MGAPLKGVDQRVPKIPETLEPSLQELVALAFLLEGEEVCAAVSLHDSQLYIATNEKISRNAPTLVHSVVHHTVQRQDAHTLQLTATVRVTCPESSEGTRPLLQESTVVRVYKLHGETSLFRRCSYSGHPPESAADALQTDEGLDTPEFPDFISLTDAGPCYSSISTIPMTIDRMKMSMRAYSLLYFLACVQDEDVSLEVIDAAENSAWASCRFNQFFEPQEAMAHVRTLKGGGRLDEVLEKVPERKKERITLFRGALAYLVHRVQQKDSEFGNWLRGHDVRDPSEFNRDVKVVREDVPGYVPGGASKNSRCQVHAELALLCGILEDHTMSTAPLQGQCEAFAASVAQRGLIVLMPNFRDERIQRVRKTPRSCTPPGPETLRLAISRPCCAGCATVLEACGYHVFAESGKAFRNWKCPDKLLNESTRNTIERACNELAKDNMKYRKFAQYGAFAKCMEAIRDCDKYVTWWADAKASRGVLDGSKQPKQTVLLWSGDVPALS